METVTHVGELDEIYLLKMVIRDVILHFANGQKITKRVRFLGHPPSGWWLSRCLPEKSLMSDSQTVGLVYPMYPLIHKNQIWTKSAVYVYIHTYMSYNHNH